MMSFFLFVFPHYVWIHWCWLSLVLSCFNCVRIAWDLHTPSFLTRLGLRYCVVGSGTAPDAGRGGGCMYVSEGFQVLVVPIGEE